MVLEEAPNLHYLYRFGQQACEYGSETTIIWKGIWKWKVYFNLYHLSIYGISVIFIINLVHIIFTINAPRCVILKTPKCVVRHTKLRHSIHQRESYDTPKCDIQHTNVSHTTPQSATYKTNVLTRHTKMRHMTHWSASYDTPTASHTHWNMQHAYGALHPCVNYACVVNPLWRDHTRLTPFIAVHVC